MLRRTKIVATLGPATNDKASLEAIIRAGVDVVRMNFSHGTAQDHMNRAEIVRTALLRPVALSVFWSTCKAPRFACASSRTTRSF